MYWAARIRCESPRSSSNPKRPERENSRSCCSLDCGHPPLQVLVTDHTRLTTGNLSKICRAPLASLAPLLGVWAHLPFVSVPRQILHSNISLGAPDIQAAASCQRSTGAAGACQAAGKGPLLSAIRKGWMSCEEFLYRPLGHVPFC